MYGPENNGFDCMQRRGGVPMSARHLFFFEVTMN